MGLATAGAVMAENLGAWAHKKFICGYRIAQWGDTKGGAVPWDQEDEAAALKRLMDGKDVQVMARATEGASGFHNAGYTHLVTVNYPGQKRGDGYQITRTDYWLVKLADKF